jgi:hypothetical protein
MTAARTTGLPLDQALLAQSGLALAGALLLVVISILPL